MELANINMGDYLAISSNRQKEIADAKMKDPLLLQVIDKVARGWTEITNQQFQGQPIKISGIEQDEDLTATSSAITFPVSEEESQIANVPFRILSDIYRFTEKNYKDKCDVTNLANANMATNRGKKASKATQRRRGAANKTSIELQEYVEKGIPTQRN
ncbi:Hypothetical predicted protein [Mytilus galloprovincialis]|uniref:Uncharacterized protein n=1 Tax=Mytilus galloprovincialis TaxID=29158 RepID=A0A8B6GD15_MYTGA|nr:Hypothetical predicted protein [Mytilus galloprovincialis]